VTDRLVGTWRLVAYETVDASGRRGKPYGDAVGRLTYDERGNMSGQVMRPDRGRVEIGKGDAQQVRAAYVGYIAYFGTYEVDPSNARVTHHVHGSLNPAWVGGDQVRDMRFDGDRLVLSTQVTKGTGQQIVHTLTWERC
jgi:hypothetical protein